MYHLERNKGISGAVGNFHGCNIASRDITSNNLSFFQINLL